MMLNLGFGICPQRLKHPAIASSALTRVEFAWEDFLFLLQTPENHTAFDSLSYDPSR
jgi:hypothetical protein